MRTRFDTPSKAHKSPGHPAVTRFNMWCTLWLGSMIGAMRRATEPRGTTDPRAGAGAAAIALGIGAGLPGLPWSSQPLPPVQLVLPPAVLQPPAAHLASELAIALANGAGLPGLPRWFEDKKACAFLFLFFLFLCLIFIVYSFHCLNFQLSLNLFFFAEPESQTSNCKLHCLHQSNNCNRKLHCQTKRQARRPTCEPAEGAADADDVSAAG